MASLTAIFNRALTEISDDRVTAPDQDTEAATVLNANWEMVRDRVLRGHPWNCAKSRDQLASSATPAFGFTYQYNWPADCLRVLGLDADTHGDAVWQVEGRKILTDEAGPLNIHYIARIEDTEQFDAALVTALAVELAATVGKRLGASNAKIEDLRKWSDDLMRSARNSDAQEGTPEEPDTSSPWLDARI